MPAFIGLLVTYSASSVIQERNNIFATRAEHTDKNIEPHHLDDLDFGYDSDFDYERDFWNFSESDSEEDDDDKSNDNKTANNTNIQIHQRRDPKRGRKQLSNWWLYVKHSDACGVHIVQKYYSRAIFSYRVFGPHAWNYQEIVRGPRSERRTFPVIIPLPMLPAKLNLTVTIDREEVMYPFANVYYEYGPDQWKSSDSRCKVGKYDRNLADLNWNERRIDCSFACL